MRFPFLVDQNNDQQVLHDFPFVWKLTCSLKRSHFQRMNIVFQPLVFSANILVFRRVDFVYAFHLFVHVHLWKHMYNIYIYVFSEKMRINSASALLSKSDSLLHKVCLKWLKPCWPWRLVDAEGDFCSGRCISLNYSLFGRLIGMAFFGESAEDHV